MLHGNYQLTQYVQFIVQNNNFTKNIGYNAGNYPTGVISGVNPDQIQTPQYDSTQSFLSSFAPQIIPQPSYLCLCSLVNNRLSVIEYHRQNCSITIRSVLCDFDFDIACLCQIKPQVPLSSLLKSLSLSE